jgi:putative transposase
MPHHVTQRGNRRQQTFFCDDDYRAYLALLVEWCDLCGVAVWGYCLMPNHVHLIVVPQTAEGLAKAIGETHRRYTRLVNFREKWRGYLWQGRFASYVMDEPHLMRAAAYVERNPVRAGLAARAVDWPWNSAATHVAGRGDAVAEGDWLTHRTAGWVCTWGEYLADRDPEEAIRLLHAHESTGRPLGDKPFVETVGTLLGRDLTLKKAGRKPKKQK